MRHLLRKSLGARLLIGNMAVATLVVASLSALFLWTYDCELDRQLASRAQLLAGYMAAQSRFAMLAGDRRELERFAGNAIAGEGVVFVEFDDALGGALATRRKNFAPAAGSLLEVRRPVMRPLPSQTGERAPGAIEKAEGEQRLGTLRLGFSTADPRAARLHFLELAVTTAIASLLLAALVQFLQLRTLLRPLQSLTALTHRVAAGDWSGRAELERPDEVGRLTAAFNRMVEKLSATLVSRQAAEAADAAKSRFLATMSHELRTPLNAIIGYSQLLQETFAGSGIDGLERDLGRIERAGQMLLQIINQVLDFSKIEANEIVLRPETFSVDEVVREIATTVEPLAAQNGNRLTAGTGTGADTVHMDLARFRQSLLNLVANACKFTHDGEVSIEVRREKGESGDWLVVNVKDTGIGISKEQQANLFQAFMQADFSTTHQYGGTGLGLAISRRMCRLMGGDISVESEIGHGANFEMRLPAHIEVES